MTLDEKLDFLYVLHYMMPNLHCMMSDEPVVLKTKKDMDIRGHLDDLIDMNMIYYYYSDDAFVPPLEYYRLTPKSRELFDQYLDFNRI